jgi:hypothetical protein
MIIPITSIGTESNVTEVLSSVLIFLVGAGRHRKRHWIGLGGGVYNLGRYMPMFT